MGPVSLHIFSSRLCSAATLHLGVRVSESLYALPATPLDQMMDPAVSPGISAAYSQQSQYLQSFLLSQNCFPLTITPTESAYEQEQALSAWTCKGLDIPKYRSSCCSDNSTPTDSPTNLHPYQQPKEYQKLLRTQGPVN